MILYRLFKPVDATLALLALVFAVVPVAIEAILLTALYVPLLVGGPSALFSAFDEGERQALGYLAVRLFFTGWGFSLLLFSGFCTLIGLLILRSSLIPRLIGALMIAAGVCYSVNSLTAILSPAVNAALLPWILLPPFAGEFSLATWLTLKGVKLADRGAAGR